MKIVDKNKVIIAERLNEYITTMFTNLYKLSKQTGINYYTLSSYHRGNATPGMDNLRLLVQGTGLSADYWIGTDGR